MTADQMIKTIEAMASLLQALSWPAIVLFLAVYFGSPLKSLLSNVGELKFKASPTGIEASVTRQQLETAALLGAASAKTSGVDSTSAIPTPEKARGIADVVSQTSKASVARRLSEATVLWVDDHPDNNIYERRALEALGLHFILSTSTNDALERLRTHKYDVTISDMGRGLDKQAGYTLLAEKQKFGEKIPFIIYAGSNSPEHKAEARQRGAFGATNDPQELFQLVLSALESE